MFFWLGKNFVFWGGGPQMWSTISITSYLGYILYINLDLLAEIVFPRFLHYNKVTTPATPFPYLNSLELSHYPCLRSGELSFQYFEDGVST